MCVLFLYKEVSRIQYYILIWKKKVLTICIDDEVKLILWYIISWSIASGIAKPWKVIFHLFLESFISLCLSSYILSWYRFLKNVVSRRNITQFCIWILPRLWKKWLNLTTSEKKTPETNTERVEWSWYVNPICYPIPWNQHT